MVESKPSTAVTQRPKTASTRPKSTGPINFHKPRTIIGNLLEHLPPPKPSTAHKRHNPVLPCSSKLLSYHWDQVTFQKHKEKLKTMKACIDNQSVSTIDPKLRSLKQQVSKKGFALLLMTNTSEMEKKIAKENELLVEKIRKTWSQPPNLQNDAHKRTMRDLDQKAKAFEHKRSQRNEAIDAQNQIFLQRIKGASATMKRKDWSDGRKEHLRYLMNMTKFPEAYRQSVKKTDKKEISKSKAVSNAVPSKA